MQLNIILRRKKVIGVDDSFMCIILKSQFLGQIYKKYGLGAWGNNLESYSSLDLRNSKWFMVTENDTNMRVCLAEVTYEGLYDQHFINLDTL